MSGGLDPGSFQPLSQNQPGWPRRLVCGCVLLALYLGTGLFDHDLWPPSEQAVAGVTWEMFTTGELAVPRINGLPYLEKPPLAYVLGWLCSTLAGHLSPGLLRLPAALLGLASLALIWGAARQYFGEGVAWVTTLLCATTLNFYAIMHRAATDGVALFFCFLCFALFIRNLDGHSPPARWRNRPGAHRWLADVPLVLALSASFYAKNLYVILIVVPPVAIYLLLTHQAGRLLRLGVLTVIGLLGAVLPWAWVLWERGGTDFLRIVFIDNIVGRYLPALTAATGSLSPLNDVYRLEKTRSPFWIVSSLTMHSLPWTLIALAALWTALREQAANPLVRFLLISLASIIACVSLSSTKEIQYYLPIIFPLLLLAAAFLHRVFSPGIDGTRWQRLLIAANCGIMISVTATATLIAFWSWRGLPMNWPWAAVLFTLALSSTAFLSGHGPVARLTNALLVVAGLMVLLLPMAIPTVDAAKTWRPFFDDIAADSGGRELFTTILDDRHVPAMTYYLNRRLTIVQPVGQVTDLLRSGRRVGVVMYPGELTSIEPQLEGIRYRTVRGRSGQDLFVFVEN